MDIMNTSAFRHILVLLLVLIAIHCANNAAITETQGLYSSEDDVNILTAKTMKNQIYGSKRAWLVEFYNSWCGFCQRFAPSWKAFSTDVKGWSDLVAISAIDCADEDNYVMCREFEVMTYPTLRYFHENLQESNRSFGVPLLPLGKEVNEHRQKLIDVIIAEQIEGRGKQYPNLRFYNYSDTSHIFDSVPSDTNYVFLIIQPSVSYLGQEVSLDLHQTTALVIRYAFLNNTDLLTNLKALQGSTTSLFVVSRDNAVEPITINNATRGGFKMAITKFLESRHIKVPNNKNQTDMFIGKKFELNISTIIKENASKAVTEIIKKIGDGVFQMDLETALRYSLKHEVAGNKEITGEKLEALKKYLDLLVKYFPFGKNGYKVLRDIQQYVLTSPIVKGMEIGMMVKRAENPDQQVFSTPKQWLACNGSSPNFRGYPCGLWKMFHYLTVNVAEGEQKSGGNNPKLALEAMHGYIKNFFSCEDCKQHFLEMAARREMDKVSSFDDAIIWLWQAHNEVNNRLSGDVSEDPKFPKIQFPSKENCPQCHNSDGSWNMSEVLHYLKQVYRNTNVNYMGADTRVLDLVPNGRYSARYNVSSSNSSGLFKSIDTSVSLTILSAAITRGFVSLDLDSN